MVNKSKLTIKDLAHRNYAQFLDEMKENPSQAFFDAGVRIAAVYPLKLVLADYEHAPEPLDDLIDNGDLDGFSGIDTESEGENTSFHVAERLWKKGGFLIHFHFQIWDFSGSTFDENGDVDGCSGNGWGYYREDFAWGETYEAALENLCQLYVKGVERMIGKGEKESKKAA